MFGFYATNSHIFPNINLRTSEIIYIYENLGFSNHFKLLKPGVSMPFLTLYVANNITFDSQSNPRGGIMDLNPTSIIYQLWGLR